MLHVLHPPPAIQSNQALYLTFQVALTKILCTAMNVRQRTQVNRVLTSEFRRRDQQLGTRIQLFIVGRMGKRHTLFGRSGQESAIK